MIYFYYKNKFVDIFQIWFLKVKNKWNNIIKAICANDGGEFIFIKIGTFYEKKSIILIYVAIYIYEENGLIEKK